MRKHDTNPTEQHSTKYWPVFSKASKLRVKKRLRNCSKLKETKEKWELNATCDPALGPFTYGQCWDSWQNLNGTVDWMVVKYRYYFSDSDDCIVIMWEDVLILRKYKFNYWEEREHPVGKLFSKGLGKTVFLHSSCNLSLILKLFLHKKRKRKDTKLKWSVWPKICEIDKLVNNKKRVKRKTSYPSHHIVCSIFS